MKIEPVGIINAVIICINVIVRREESVNIQSILNQFLDKWKRLEKLCQVKFSQLKLERDVFKLNFISKVNNIKLVKPEKGTQIEN